MANDILVDVVTGTPIVFADAGAFDNTPFADTHDITFAGLAAGGSRESPKADLADALGLGAKLPQRWAVLAAFEFADAPAATATVDIYWAPSPSAGAGDDNPYLITGVDAAVVETASMLGQLQFIGSVPLQAVADVVFSKVFITTFAMRYGTLLVHNNTAVAFEAGELIHVTLMPLVDEAQ